MFPGGSRHEIKTDQKMEKQQWMWFRYDNLYDNYFNESMKLFGLTSKQG